MGWDEIVNFGRKSFCYLACKIYGLFSATFDLSLFVSGKVCECGVSFFFSGQTKRTRIWHFVRVELSFASSVLHFFLLFSCLFCGERKVSARLPFSTPVPAHVTYVRIRMSHM